MKNDEILRQNIRSLDHLLIDDIWKFYDDFCIDITTPLRMMSTIPIRLVVAGMASPIATPKDRKHNVGITHRPNQSRIAVRKSVGKKIQPNKGCYAPGTRSGADRPIGAPPENYDKV